MKKEVVEKFIDYIEKYLPDYEILDFRAPKKGEYFVSSYGQDKSGKIAFNVCKHDTFYIFINHDKRFIVKKKRFPKRGELVAVNDEGYDLFVQFKELAEDVGFLSMGNMKYLSPPRKITEEERKILFPDHD